MYKIDTHVHTSEVSQCGKVNAVHLVHLYKESGYSSIVITDHFFKGYFDNLGNMKWEDKVDEYMSGYNIALREGKKVGLNVLFGLELRFTENINDYLVYGVDRDFLKENENIFELGIEGFSKLVKHKDIIVYQAHPYRKGIVPADPRFLNGVEVYNGNPRHNSRNDLALKFADNNKLKKISGSDFHQITDLARGGIYVSKNPKTTEEFYRILKEDKIMGLIETE